ncbi:hypothetical protein AB0D11_40010 [Streptomyces monashensis]|uniref:hypothetical protein n=1 Tax=Streptomyces monashensis TaxID=1678012 RepID=UPI00340B87AE
MNAHCERRIGTLRREVRDRLLIGRNAHARHVLGAYARHCNRHRAHRAPGTASTSSQTNTPCPRPTWSRAGSCALEYEAAPSTGTDTQPDQ